MPEEIMMTKKLTLTGYSDDLFCVSIDGKPYEEIDTCGKGKAIYSLQSGDDRMLVIAEYGCDIWVIGVSQICDGVPIPD
ncbi:hypothetical protein RHO13_00935 [Orbus wheelerorum]|uniref:hypothetical protein n=1 Tax=Orbus wheelerorum TaxID=3074111 RepID=UPI00370D4AB6